MSDQHDGPLDKVKDAVGMGEDDEQETGSLPDTPEDRADGWAGVDGALGGAPEGTVESGYGSGTPPRPDRIDDGSR